MATYITCQAWKCTDIVELCTYTDVSFWFQLFDLPCWLACMQRLAASLNAAQAGLRVSRLFKFKHTSLIGISLWSSYHTVPPPFQLGWGLIQQPQAQL